jgi:hypothetical protein
LGYGVLGVSEESSLEASDWIVLFCEPNGSWGFLLRGLGGRGFGWGVVLGEIGVFEGGKGFRAGCVGFSMAMAGDRIPILILVV